MAKIVTAPEHPLESILVTPTDSPLALDSLDYSVDDDLFAPLAETVSLRGSGPFVINLHASSAPINLPNGDVAGCRHAYLYRIQRIEDGRMRYRLRLGPFVREDEVVAVLTRVRNDYPGALTATACSEDLSAIAKMQAKAVSVQLSAEEMPEKAAPVVCVAAPDNGAADRPTELSTVTVLSPEPSVAAPANRAPTVSLVNHASAISRLFPELAEDLQLVDDVQQAPEREAASLPERNPGPDDTGIIDVTSISLVVEMPLPKTSDTAMESALELVFDEVESPPEIAAARQASPRQATTTIRGPAPPSIESTQTLRPLTSLELENGASRWFVIQLSVADHAFDPATVPNLDIFVLYTLYSVEGVDQGRVMHALRLGFFGEEMAAQAVANYLGTYYDKPAVKRVSVAERERFAEHRLAARKDVGETGQHSAIEITGELTVEKPRITRPAAVPATTRQKSLQPAKKDKPAGLFASLPWVKRRS